jgi:hypothetical protein
MKLISLDLQSREQKPEKHNRLSPWLKVAGFIALIAVVSYIIAISF